MQDWLSSANNDTPSISTRAPFKYSRTLSSDTTPTTNGHEKNNTPPTNRTSREIRGGLNRNVSASRFNEPYGRQGYVLARTVEFNQGGKFDGNESVADSF
ncbi:hypothetical protein TNCV_4597391 [Trichonephila clavipes]|nr:hypothetical protein TNCV_4597391 [Trichonephila clavipes]